MRYKKLIQDSFFNQGFSLLEILMTVAIVSILARLAIPAYQEAIQRSWRSDARIVLLSNAQYLARTYSENLKYRTSAQTPVLPLSTAPINGAQTRYNITVVTPDDFSYTLTATPTGWTDSTCGNLTLDHLGTRLATAASGASANNDCWMR